MKDKKKTLDKENEKLMLNKKSKKQKLQEHGITLIALVVTIIILLILAGVTLNIALSDNGLFSKAKKAAEDYKQAQREEEDLISQFATQMNSEYVGATVEGYELSSKTVKIEGTTSGLSNNKDSAGNTIDGVETDGSQEFTTDTEMKWRVWDYDGNILRIIGDPTDNLTLNGPAGYNNGVWALDNICNTLYTNGKKGVKATNLKRTDIQKVSTYDYTKYKHKPDSLEEYTLDDDSDDLIYFGAIKQYGNESAKFPDMWEDNDKDWTYKYDNESKTAIGSDGEGKVWEEIGTGEGKMNNSFNEGNNSTAFKQSFYRHSYKMNEFINTTYYDLIFKDTDGNRASWFWLACRYVYLNENECGFGLQHVNGWGSTGEVSASSMGNSSR